MEGFEFGGSLHVPVVVIEELLSFHELSDMCEFMYDVEVEVGEFTVVEVVSADA